MLILTVIVDSHDGDSDISGRKIDCNLKIEIIFLYQAKMSDLFKPC